MPVFVLSQEPVFPPPHYAEPSGLLAIGGDLGIPRLVRAYSRGIFPWYDDESPILWWAPDPRPILVPSELHISKRLRRTIKAGKFTVTLDTDFRGVITGCANAGRATGDGTWIVPDMIRAYCALFEHGYAHSVEARLDGELVGGAYGVALGKAFFGESMFHAVSNASKVAFVHLAALLDRLGFHFIDCQQATGHLMRFGAREIPRRDFLKRLERAKREKHQPGPWTNLLDESPL